MILAHSITAAQRWRRHWRLGIAKALRWTAAHIIEVTTDDEDAVVIGSVPFKVATRCPKEWLCQFFLLSGCKVVVSIKADNRPLDCFANSLNLPSTQFRQHQCPRWVGL